MRVFGVVEKDDGITLVFIHDDSVPRRFNLAIGGGAEEVAEVADQRVLILFVMIVNVLSIVQHLQSNSVSPHQSQQVPVSVQTVSNLSLVFLKSWIVLEASHKALVEASVIYGLN